MAGMPGTGPQVRAANRPVHPLAPALARHAPLTLRCQLCRKICCATLQRLVLWHGERDGDGQMHECAGAGLEGLDLEDGA